MPGLFISCGRSGRHGLRDVLILLDLIEVHVAIDLGALLVDHADVGHVLGLGRDLAQARADRSQLGRTQEHVGVAAQAIREVAGRGGEHRRALAHLRLVAHAQRAAGHFHARSRGAERTVDAFLGQLRGVHLGRRRDPQAGRDVALAFQQLGGGAEVTDVGHARTDEHFVDHGTRDIRQRLHIVRVVRASQQRLVHVGEIDVDDRRVLGIGIGLQQLRVGQPLFHLRDAAAERTGVGVAFGDHPLQQRDVAGEVLDDRLLVQAHGAAGGGTFGRGVGQFERLLHLQVRQAFDLEDAAGEDVLLARLGHGQQPRLDGVVRDRVDQVAQRHARLQLALETDQHRFRHVQRHHAGGGGERDQAGAGRERNANREARVRVAAGTDGVGHQHAVEPAVDHAVARAQRNAAAGGNELRQRVVRLHVDRLRIGRGVAEGLHHQIGGETQAGQVLQLVAGHRAGGVLRTHRGHLRFAVGTRAHALAFRQPAGATHHLLREREALAAVGRLLRLAEQVRRRQLQRFARFRGQAATDDQRDSATRTHFVEQHVGLHLELGDHVAVLQCLAVVRAQLDHVAVVHLRHVEFDRQRAGVFHRVVEDGGDLAAQADATEALVRDERDVLAGEPQHAVGRRLARGAGTDHVADVGDQMALVLQRQDLLDRAALAVLFRHERRIGALVLQHRQCVQRDVRTRGGVGRRRQVVGIGLARHLEDGDGEALRHFRLAGEPFGVGPALQHGLRVGIALLRLLLHVVEAVEHQQRVLQPFGGGRAQLGVVEQLDQRVDVVAAQHRAQQLGGARGRDQRGLLGTERDGGQVGRLHLGGIVDAGGHAVRDQLDQEVLFTGRRVLQQFDDLGRLLGRQRQRRDTQRGALGYVVAIGFQHG